MFRAIACVLVVAALPSAPRADELHLHVIQESVSLKRSDILEAKLTFVEGRPAVSITFGPDAAKRFGDVTSRNIGKVMQLVVGDRIVTAPVIRTAITGGSLVIEGGMTVQQAQELADRLK
jgi:preprotein translocase subunit SecD